MVAKRKKNSKPEKLLLTQVELEMMRVLWANEGGTVRDVLDALAPERKLAYTSVSTILRILEQKGALEARKDGRGHVYIPKLDRREYELRALGHLVGNVFNGTPTLLVQRLLELENIDRAEIESIKKLLSRES